MGGNSQYPGGMTGSMDEYEKAFANLEENGSTFSATERMKLVIRNLRGEASDWLTDTLRTRFRDDFDAA